MSTIVFAGPSIHQTELAAYANITFCPPAASGDILAAINVGARTIGLIDGVFGDCAAVWHKELLFALSKGVAVYGAASMGALRAAECDCFGMKGVGQIYEQYRDGSRISDADVAVLHGPPDMDFRPVTIALVDAEETIRALQSRIGDEQAHSLLNAARRTHFSRRTWRSIVTAAQLGQELTSLLSHNAISVKRLDAQMLLDAVNNHRHDAGARPAWRFQNTLFFQEMIARNAEQAARFAAPPIR
ncbi:TfuA-like protein [Neorhizobium sp. BT27B]|uniref:TfuA-like protein n=1 Tax=Neorhizobium sp. BT27B TaxID=3142625 RepID=UPI003D2C984E